MGWRNRLHPLTKEQQVMLQKASKQLWPFYNVLFRTSWVEFLNFETGLWLEGNHGTCSLMLPWSSPISGATQKTREAAISPRWLRIFCPPSFNYKWPNCAPIFKTNSPACTLKSTLPPTYSRMLVQQIIPIQTPIASPPPSSKQNHWTISQFDHWTSLSTAVFACTPVLPHLLSLFSTW